MSPTTFSFIRGALLASSALFGTRESVALNSFGWQPKKPRGSDTEAPELNSWEGGADAICWRCADKYRNSLPRFIAPSRRTGIILWPAFYQHSRGILGSVRKGTVNDSWPNGADTFLEWNVKDRFMYWREFETSSIYKYAQDHHQWQSNWTAAAWCINSSPVIQTSDLAE